MAYGVLGFAICTISPADERAALVSLELISQYFGQLLMLLLPARRNRHADRCARTHRAERTANDHEFATTITKVQIEE
jgi:hypothetical protein